MRFCPVASAVVLDVDSPVSAVARFTYDTLLGDFERLEEANISPKSSMDRGSV